MKKIMKRHEHVFLTVLMIAIIVFSFSITFNLPRPSFPQKTVTFPKITFKPGIFLPHATLPAASTFRPIIDVHASFFNIF